MLQCPGRFYVHVPKTGGTYVRRRLLDLGIGAELVWNARKAHAPLAELPPEWLEGRRVFSVIREPCAWYLSWVHHYTHPVNGPHGQLLDRVGADPIDFRETVHRLLDGWGNPARYIRGFGSTGRTQALQEAQENGWGLMRWMYHHLTDDRVEDWIDLSDIDGGLSRLLSLDIEPAEPLNVNGKDDHHAPHGPILEYFDRELAERVYHREAWAIDRFGFCGPGSAALRGVV